MPWDLFVSLLWDLGLMCHFFVNELVKWSNNVWRLHRSPINHLQWKKWYMGNDDMQIEPTHTSLSRVIMQNNVQYTNNEIYDMPSHYSTSHHITSHHITLHRTYNITSHNSQWYTKSIQELWHDRCKWSTTIMCLLQHYYRCKNSAVPAVRPHRKLNIPPSIPLTEGGFLRQLLKLS